jgi:hypothetical protein
LSSFPPHTVPGMKSSFRPLTRRSAPRTSRRTGRGSGRLPAGPANSGAADRTLARLTGRRRPETLESCRALVSAGQEKHSAAEPRCDC